MIFKKVAFLSFIFVALSNEANADEYSPFKLSSAELSAIATDSIKPHEAYPAGVPSSYDWATTPRKGAGNNPNGFTSATGWGQAFYANGLAGSIRGSFLVRNFQTYVCNHFKNGMKWSLVQRGPIEGKEFRADFAGNISNQPPVFVETEAIAEVSFSIGKAFHFWPKMGRFDLSSQNVCGILVYFEAMQITGAPQSILLGVGADYWATPTAAWDNFKTNKDLAIGRLKLLNNQWQIIGLSTAFDDALKVLHEVGYVDLTNHTARIN